MGLLSYLPLSGSARQAWHRVSGTDESAAQTIQRHWRGGVSRTFAQAKRLEIEARQRVGTVKHERSWLKCCWYFDFNGICEGKGSRLANLVCAPIVLPLQAAAIYLWPCVKVLGTRIFIAQCANPTDLFTDEEFPPNATSLGEGSEHSDAAWKRAPEMLRRGRANAGIALISDGVSHHDVCQGALGDCWLLAACACLAERGPALLKRLFLTREVDPHGKYRIQLYDDRVADWVTLVVDDWVPCSADGQPLFTKPNGNELWMLLLEKAFAKFCGSYAALDGGFALWALHVMTGDLVFRFSRREPGLKGTWSRVDLGYQESEKNQGDARDYQASLAWRGRLGPKLNAQELYLELSRYHETGAVMGASFSGGREVKDEENLVSGHAYSLLQLREVLGFRLVQVTAPHEMMPCCPSRSINVPPSITTALPVASFPRQLRNPWGSFEYNGDWSDRSEMWDRHPQVQEELWPTRQADLAAHRDDGAFWIPFEYFVERYTSVDVCDASHGLNDLALTYDETLGAPAVVCGCLRGCFEYWFCLQGCVALYAFHESTGETESRRAARCRPPCCASRLHLGQVAALGGSSAKASFTILKEEVWRLKRSQLPAATDAQIDAAVRDWMREFKKEMDTSML